MRQRPAEENRATRAAEGALGWSADPLWGFCSLCSVWGQGGLGWGGVCPNPMKCGGDAAVVRTAGGKVWGTSEPTTLVLPAPRVVAEGGARTRRAQRHEQAFAPENRLWGGSLAGSVLCDPQAGGAEVTGGPESLQRAGPRTRGPPRGRAESRCLWRGAEREAPMPPKQGAAWGGTAWLPALVVAGRSPATRGGEEERSGGRAALKITRGGGRGPLPQPRAAAPLRGGLMFDPLVVGRGVCFAWGGPA